MIVSVLSLDFQKIELAKQIVEESNIRETYRRILNLTKRQGDCQPE